MISSRGVEAWGEEPPEKSHQAVLTSSLAKNIIIFSDDNVKEIHIPYNNVVVVSMMIANYDVKKISL